MSDMQSSAKQIAVGLLLAVAILALLFAGVPLARAQTLTTLHSFTGSPDGAVPNGGLVLDAEANLYGTTQGGGTDFACSTDFSTGCGTVFQVTASGTEKVLHSFNWDRYPPSIVLRRPWVSDGATPVSSLVMDAQGNLYGTTTAGGGCGGAWGCGTVFEVTASGREKVLHNFTGSPDGSYPEAPLVLDAQGNLYGTTWQDGTYGSDTVFEVTASGTEKVFYSFAGYPDGGSVGAGLVLDAQGNLYGTTYAGGANAVGTVFKLTPSGTETVLYSFCQLPNCADGAFPVANLVLDAQGNLYGTTEVGGTYWRGTVFEVTTSGTEKVLYSFAGQPDGAIPFGGLVLDAQGNLYGTTYAGGTSSACNFENPGCGTVFELAASGAEKVLYSFHGGPDGANPSAGLVLDAQGNLYGTTSYGGSGNCTRSPGCGTVFKLTP